LAQEVPEQQLRVRVCIFALLLSAVTRVPLGADGVAPPVVTADLKTLEAAADPPLTIFLRPTPRASEFSFGFRNESAGALTVTLRVSNVPFDAVDIYDGGRFAGTFTRRQLQDGVALRVSSGVLPPDLRAVVGLHEALLEEMNRSLSLAERRSEVGARMLGLREMARAVMAADRAERSARLILLESGRPTSRGAAASPVDRETVLRQAREFLEDVERVRRFLESSQLDAAGRARYHGWLLPLDVRAERAGPASLRVSAVNRSTLPVSASLALPSAAEGGGVPEVRLDVQPGRTVEVAVPLKPGSSGAVPARLEGRAGDYAFSRSFDLILPREDEKAAAGNRP
jgi:hypothetical protein